MCNAWTKSFLGEYGCVQILSSSTTLRALNETSRLYIPESPSFVTEYHFSWRKDEREREYSHRIVSWDAWAQHGEAGRVSGPRSRRTRGQRSAFAAEKNGKMFLSREIPYLCSRIIRKWEYSYTDALSKLSSRRQPSQSRPLFFFSLFVQPHSSRFTLYVRPHSLY